MEPLVLSDLLHFDLNLEIIGQGDPLITSLTEDSRSVQKGSVFFARSGLQHKGSDYITEAISRGAAAIATEHFTPNLSPHIIQLISSNIPKLMGEMGACFYRPASEDLLCIGVTGTAGKTSVTYWLRYLLEELGKPTGLIGTIEWIGGKEAIEAPLTTPGSLTCHRLMHEMVQSGKRACVMEVSSHSLSQERVSGIDFDAAIFTNLSPEHLDYHKTMEAYGSAKRKLFEKAPLAILNHADPYVRATPTLSDPIYFGEGGDVFAEVVEGSYMSVTAWKKRGDVILPGMAPFQISNFLAALAALMQLGYAFEDLLKIAPHFPGVPGRMEEISNDRGLHIIVDYAHKPDALEQVLKTLKEKTLGRLLLVFGCGGERDREKRPQMGAIAAKYADQIWITSDNPRLEDPIQIMQEIAGGCDKSAILQVSRAQAIFAAIEEAGTGDTILVAGRGHESDQLIGLEKIPFHDASVIRTALLEKSPLASS